MVPIPINQCSISPSFLQCNQFLLSRFRCVLLALAVLLIVLATACGTGASATGNPATVVVTVGYQSKTIDTVTAGTLLRDRGIFEREPS